MGGHTLLWHPIVSSVFQTSELVDLVRIIFRKRIRDTDKQGIPKDEEFANDLIHLQNQFPVRSFERERKNERNQNSILVPLSSLFSESVLFVWLVGFVCFFMSVCSLPSHPSFLVFCFCCVCFFWTESQHLFSFSSFHDYLTVFCVLCMFAMASKLPHFHVFFLNKKNNSIITSPLSSPFACLICSCAQLGYRISLYCSFISVFLIHCIRAFWFLLLLKTHLNLSPTTILPYLHSVLWCFSLLPSIGSGES